MSLKAPNLLWLSGYGLLLPFSQVWPLWFLLSQVSDSFTQSLFLFQNLTNKNDCLFIFYLPFYFLILYLG